ncbi:unnamed protein product [Hydatigera taeniaeformis]|uniref:Secreted protein n=1 Tax=Hydatigena taeniaeformis TaxID=6205 RepID=A0A0R3WPU9_HYDTA|nr:unnamed protein product [Hydatigera taeniaeformis]
MFDGYLGMDLVWSACTGPTVALSSLISRIASKVMPSSTWCEVCECNDQRCHMFLCFLAMMCKGVADVAADMDEARLSAEPRNVGLLRVYCT